MTATVVIDLPDPDKGSPEAAALIESCSNAVAHGECALAPGEAYGHAVVRWVSGDAHIEVVAGTKSLTRDVHFEEQDPKEERYRTIGLVIATLYGEAVTAAQPVPPPAPPPKKPESFAKLIFQGSTLFGTGLDSGPARIGAMLDVAFRPTALPFAIVFGTSASFRGREPTSDPSVGLAATWVTLDLGPRLMLPVAGAFALEMRPVFLLSWFQAAASVGVSESGSRWVAGAGADVDFVLDYGVVGAFLRVRGAAGQATSIRVQGFEVAKDPGVSLAVMFGIRLAVWR